MSRLKKYIHYWTLWFISRKCAWIGPVGRLDRSSAFRETFTLGATGADGSKKTLHCTQRYYTCPGLKWLLEQAGFRIIRFFGVTEAGFDRRVRPSKDHFEIGVVAER